MLFWAVEERFIPCPACGEQLGWTRSARGELFVDCMRGHRASTPAAEWEQMRQQALIAHIELFLHFDEPPACRKHRWETIQISGGLVVLVCGRCDGFAVAEHPGPHADSAV